MFSYFSWALFPRQEIIVQSIIMGIIVIGYLYLTYHDFKSKEVQLGHLLIVGVLNLFLPFISIILYGCKCMIPLLSGAFILWIAGVWINDRVNSEKTIGMADIDIVWLQALITIATMVFVFAKRLQGSAFVLVSTSTIMGHLQTILLGYLIIIVIWMCQMIYKRFKTKEKLWTLIKATEKLPIIVVFLPLVISNLYVVLGAR